MRKVLKRIRGARSFKRIVNKTMKWTSISISCTLIAIVTMLVVPGYGSIGFILDTTITTCSITALMWPLQNQGRKPSGRSAWMKKRWRETTLMVDGRQTLGFECTSSSLPSQPQTELATAKKAAAMVAGGRLNEPSLTNKISKDSLVEIERPASSDPIVISFAQTMSPDKRPATNRESGLASGKKSPFPWEEPDRKTDSPCEETKCEDEVGLEASEKVYPTLPLQKTKA